LEEKRYEFLSLASGRRKQRRIIIKMTRTAAAKNSSSTVKETSSRVKIHKSSERIAPSQCDKCVSHLQTYDSGVVKKRPFIKQRLQLTSNTPNYRISIMVDIVPNGVIMNLK
jgi:hypothetical protein